MAARAHWFDGEEAKPRRRRPQPRLKRSQTLADADDVDGRRAGNRPAAPLHRHARAAAEGADDPLRRRAGPADRARPGRKAARAGNLVERAAGCDRNRPRPGTAWGVRFARARASVRVIGAPRSSCPSLRGGAGPADRRTVLASPGAPGRRLPGSKRRASGCGPVAAGWSCRRRTAARRSGRASCPAPADGAGRRSASGCGAWARCSAVTMWCTSRSRRADWPSAGDRGGAAGWIATGPQGPGVRRRRSGHCPVNDGSGANG